LRRLGIGEDRYDIEMIGTILLYNESLQSLDLSHNSISRIAPLMQQLIRNKCSNLLELNLAYNAIEAEELA
jgi:Leucine-rich repeat (LRR) protein